MRRMKSGPYIKAILVQSYQPSKSTWNLIYSFIPARENIHILAAVLRSGEEPTLSRAQMQRVVRSHRAHQEYLKHRDSLADSDDDDGPQNEDAWLFEDLTVLTKLNSRLREKEQLISLIFEVCIDTVADSVSKLMKSSLPHREQPQT